MSGMSLLYYTKNLSFLPSGVVVCQVYSDAIGFVSISFFKSLEVCLEPMSTM